MEEISPFTNDRKEISNTIQRGGEHSETLGLTFCKVTPEGKTDTAVGLRLKNMVKRPRGGNLKRERVQDMKGSSIRQEIRVKLRRPVNCSPKLL